MRNPNSYRAARRKIVRLHGSLTKLWPTLERAVLKEQDRGRGAPIVVVLPKEYITDVYG